MADQEMDGAILAAVKMQQSPPDLEAQEHESLKTSWTLYVGDT